MSDARHTRHSTHFFNVSESLRIECRKPQDSLWVKVPIRMSGVGLSGCPVISNKGLPGAGLPFENRKTKPVMSFPRLHRLRLNKQTTQPLWFIRPTHALIGCCWILLTWRTVSHPTPDTRPISLCFGGYSDRESDKTRFKKNDRLHSSVGRRTPRNSAGQDSNGQEVESSTRILPFS